MNDCLEQLISKIEEFELVTITSDSSPLKTEFLRRLLATIGKFGKEVHFLDFDLQFSSYLNNLKQITGFHFDPSLEFYLFQPEEGRVEDSVVELLSEFSSAKRGGLVVLDSLNTLQNLIRIKETDIDSVDANHKAAILITLIQQGVKNLSKTILVTTITRERPITSGLGETSWDRSPSGGRMMLFKSGAILSLSFQNESDRNNTRCVARLVRRNGAGQVNKPQEKEQVFEIDLVA